MQTGQAPDTGADTGAGSAERREGAVTSAFVAIANALVDGYDLVDLYAGLTADCARILDVGWAGLLLADHAGVLRVMGASSEHAHNLELFQVQCQDGPCLDCYRSGDAVLVPDLGAEQARWPRFAPVAVEAGFLSVHALPMRLGDTTLGALGLFGAATGTLNSADLVVAQALAHVAVIALVAGRAAADKTTLAEQLQIALDSRVVLEQAKGILAQLGDLDMGEAFAALRRYARDHNQKLSDVAAQVVARRAPAAAVLAHARAKGALSAATPG
jgi:hypothetical protein